MSVKVTWRGDEWAKRFEAATRAGVIDGADLFVTDVKRYLGRYASHASASVPFKSSPVGGPPAASTTTLQGSINREDPIRVGNIIRIRAGTNLVYAPIHEFGGVIKGRPWLTIPVHPRAKRFSQQGLSARKVAMRLINKKNKKGLFFTKSKKGDPMLARRVGTKKNPRIEIWYVLKKQVVIPKRPFMLPRFRATADKVTKQIARTIRRSLGL